MHMMRADSPHFEIFGEVYFSFVKQGIVKAWKRHRQMTQNFAVPVGRIKLVVFDDRADSPTRGVVNELITGADEYCLIRIPAQLWYGFKGLGDDESMMANCATLPHDPLEVDLVEPESFWFSYRW